MYSPPLTSCLPLGEKARDVMGDLPPDISRTQVPLWMSQSRHVQSRDPVAKYLPLQWNLEICGSHNTNMQIMLQYYNYSYDHESYIVQYFY